MFVSTYDASNQKPIYQYHIDFTFYDICQDISKNAKSVIAAQSLAPENIVPSSNEAYDQHQQDDLLCTSHCNLGQLLLVMSTHFNFENERHLDTISCNRVKLF